MAKGGTRKNSGRKPKDRTPDQVFEDAESYLTGVVQGTVAPDALRVRAAVALLGYQKPKQRPRPKSKTPGELHRKEALAAESAIVADFEAKAKIIRERHARKNES